MRPKTILIIFVAIALAFIGAYLFVGLTPTLWDYALPRRATSILAIITVGAAIAFSTFVFQTITHNRILTPSIIGLDSLYILIQTILIFAFGTAGLALVSTYVQFGMTLVLMVLFSLLLYVLLFRREQKNLYFLLLVGIVCGTLFSSLSTFMQVLIDPNEFLTVQSRMFASFNNVQVDLLWIALVILAATTVYIYPQLKYLDVIALGRDQAINLGVPYDQAIRKFLIVIAIFVSVSTALVGPVLFLGLLVTNVARELLKTSRHAYSIALSMLISVVALVAGTFMLERVLSYAAPLSVVINFVGGTYFIYLLLKGAK
ncbi:iron chelate uptake ABC transporter family permease subunit [Shouchella lonarensis]|uniref:Iron complex transport system permease protein n=1 Tax=Shouchella lonarensis TaxID=1464122 RepID=A0A1G6MG09_9BACI|nr:iron chelate uptake ABC transporter family permease subunit [Shouchella lonarensis]SDC54443.1 iron complex transport system permease protein [Shouchella lonarensis]